MITVISGKPGGGKTALCVSMLRAYAAEGRRIYLAMRVNEKTGAAEPSIPDLAIPHELLQDVKKWDEPGAMVDGSVLVLDEAQKVWRQRPSGSAVPREVAAMEEHRHRGFDLIFMTQAPNLLDQNLRGLVGRHINLRNLGVLGRRWDEWFDAVGNVTSPSGLKTADVKKRWALPKDSFGAYKSASVHVAAVRSVPRALIIGGVCIVIAVGLVIRGVMSVRAKTDPKPEAQASAGAASQPRGLGTRAVQPAGQGGLTATALRVSAAVRDREPYAGLGLHLAGTFEVDGKRRTWFAVSIGGRTVATVREADLFRAGYSWRHLAPCTGVLNFGELERLVTCDAPARAVQDPARAGPLAPPSGAGSAPAA